jgi:hypothetical protein
MLFGRRAAYVEQLMSNRSGPARLHSMAKNNRRHRPRRKTYAQQAEECRRMAEVCAEEFRDGYLKLAAEYELRAGRAVGRLMPIMKSSAFCVAVIAIPVKPTGYCDAMPV